MTNPTGPPSSSGTIAVLGHTVKDAPALPTSTAKLDAAERALAQAQAEVKAQQHNVERAQRHADSASEKVDDAQRGVDEAQARLAKLD